MILSGSIGRLRAHGLGHVLTGGTITLELEDIYLCVAPAMDAADPDIAAAVRRWRLALAEKLAGPDAR